MVAMAFPAIASSILVGASAALPDLLPPELRWLPTVLAFCAGGLASLALASLDHAASDDEELVVVAAPPLPVDAKVSPLPARKISAKRTWDASPPTRFLDALCRAGDDRTERALWAVGVLDALARDDAKGWRAVLTQPSLVVSQRRSDYAGGPTAWRLRMRGVRATPEAVARLLQDEARQTTWNPTLVGYDVLAEEAGFPDAFGRPTRVTKTTAAAECGGLVSSRDFTNLLRTERRGDRFLVGGTGLVDDAYPPVAGAVRGFNGPSGWVVEPGAGGADVTWIIGSDLRGWLSRALIDAAISTVMVKFARALNERVGKDDVM